MSLEPDVSRTVARKLTKLTIIIAAYNERDRIQKTLDFALRLRTTSLNNGSSEETLYEIIVVDDGSTDDTWEIAKKYPVAVLRYDNNKGIGYAFRHGIKHASGDALLLIPADFSDYHVIDRMILELRNGADMVQTSKRHSESIVKGYGSLRWLFSNSWNLLVRVLFQVDVGDTDYAHGLSYRTAMLSSVHGVLDGAAGEAEMIIRGYKQGFRLAEIPCSIGHSGRQFVPIPTVVRAAIDLLKLRFILWANPLEVFSTPFDGQIKGAGCEVRSSEDWIAEDGTKNRKP